MKLGTQLTIFNVAVGATTAILAALSAAHQRNMGTTLFTSMPVTAFVLAAILGLGTYGISQAASHRTANEVLHP